MLDDSISGVGLTLPTRRIEVCGGIASGKTTLARLTGRIGVAQVLEDFVANPFWKAFYADPRGMAFETEISFLLQHYHAIKVANTIHGNFACDFSLDLDLAYANVTLSGGKRGAFETLFEEVRKDLSHPALLIHLRCDPSVELERIRRRGREAEKSITLSYLDMIGSKLEEVLAERRSANPHGTFLVINSDTRNFAQRENEKWAVLEEVGAAIGLTARSRREGQAA